MELIRNNKPTAAIAAVIAAAIVAWLAFGFFGIQAAFIDDEVNMSDPFATEAGTSTDGSDNQTDADETMADDSASTDGESASTDGESTSTADDSASTADDSASAEGAGGEQGSAAFVESSGGFIPLEHAVTGQATILSDGERRFLRFEDFEVDNGPDLFVYLVAGASAEGDKDLFDDDFVNLGRLAGNVGDQNYEVAIDLDLDRYNTVVIWCDRFNASFAAADLA